MTAWPTGDCGALPALHGSLVLMAMACFDPASAVESAEWPPATCCAAPPQVGSEAIDAAALDEAAGVGVEVGPDQIRAAVAQCVQDNEATLREER